METLSVGFLWLHVNKLTICERIRFFFFSRNCQGLGFRNIYVSYIHISFQLVHLVGFIVEGGRLTFHPELKVKRQAATKIKAQLSTTHTL